MEEDPSWVRDPENPDAILALPEYAVQLGCLNFLRQVGYRAERDFTYLKRFRGGEDLMWERAYQCLERLRHAFMVRWSLNPTMRELSWGCALKLTGCVLLKCYKVLG